MFSVSNLNSQPVNARNYKAQQNTIVRKQAFEMHPDVWARAQPATPCLCPLPRPHQPGWWLNLPEGTLPSVILPQQWRHCLSPPHCSTELKMSFTKSLTFLKTTNTTVSQIDKAAVHAMSFRCVMTRQNKHGSDKTKNTSFENIWTFQFEIKWIPKHWATATWSFIYLEWLVFSIWLLLKQSSSIVVASSSGSI